MPRSPRQPVPSVHEIRNLVQLFEGYKSNGPGQTALARQLGLINGQMTPRQIAHKVDQTIGRWVNDPNSPRHRNPRGENLRRLNALLDSKPRDLTYRITYYKDRAGKELTRFVTIENSRGRTLRQIMDTQNPEGLPLVAAYLDVLTETLKHQSPKIRKLGEGEEPDADETLIERGGKRYAAEEATGKVRSYELVKIS